MICGGQLQVAEWNPVLFIPYRSWIVQPCKWKPVDSGTVHGYHQLAAEISGREILIFYDQRLWMPEWAGSY